MPERYDGNLEELKDAVAACGLDGEWKLSDVAYYYSYRAKTGEIVNWWPKKKKKQSPPIPRPQPKRIPQRTHGRD